MGENFDLENLFKEAEKTVEEIAKKKKTKDSTTETEVEISKDKEELLEEISRLNSKLEDVRAEFSNFKQRTIKEKEKLSLFVEADLLKEIINIVDIFDYAKKTFSRGSNHTVEEYQKGFELLYREFLVLLNKLGLEKIESIGRKFDPNFHHVVSVVESENGEDNVIIDEIKSGYVYKGIVIRPSMVKVSKNKK